MELRTRRSTAYLIRCTISLAAALLTALTADCDDKNQGYTFRRTHWGMTEEQVRESEGTKPAHEAGNEVHRAISYKDKLAGHECFVVYTFADGLLVKAKYLITEQHNDPQLYLDVFTELRQLLSKDLGEPMESAEWRDNHLRGTPELWGTAVTAGHLVLEATWDRGSTHVIGTLSGGDNRATIEIQYLYRFKKGE